MGGSTIYLKCTALFPPEIRYGFPNPSMDRLERDELCPIQCAALEKRRKRGATLTRPISRRAVQQSEMSVSIFRNVPVCRYIDNISVNWYPCGPEYSTGTGTVGWAGRRTRMIFVFYALSRALHFTRFLYGGEPVLLIDGIEAHSVSRRTHLPPSVAVQICDSRMTISFAPQIRRALSLFFFLSFIRVSHIWTCVCISGCNKNLPASTRVRDWHLDERIDFASA